MYFKSYFLFAKIIDSIFDLGTVIEGTDGITIVKWGWWYEAVLGSTGLKNKFRLASFVKHVLCDRLFMNRVLNIIIRRLTSIFRTSRLIITIKNISTRLNVHNIIVVLVAVEFRNTTLIVILTIKGTGIPVLLFSLHDQIICLWHLNLVYSFAPK